MSEKGKIIFENESENFINKSNIAVGGFNVKNAQQLEKKILKLEAELTTLRAANEWKIIARDGLPEIGDVPRIVTLQKQTDQLEVTIAFYDTDDCCWLYPYSKLVVGSFDGSTVIAWTDFPAAAEVE